MKYVGVDLHKQVIKVCVFRKEAGTPVREYWKTFDCPDVNTIRDFFAELGEFEVAVEATANYEWFCLLIEKLASRIVLVHPKKMRIIAESTRKTDKVDSAVLGEFLALNMLPEAWRPTPPHARVSGPCSASPLRPTTDHVGEEQAAEQGGVPQFRCPRIVYERRPETLEGNPDEQRRPSDYRVAAP